MYILVFSIDNRRYAIDLAVVERCVLAAAVTPLPNSPTHTLGAIDIHGKVMSVIDLRQLLGLPARPLEAEDRFIICKEPTPIILWVDSIKEVKSCDEGALTPGLGGQHSILEDKGSITFLLDLPKLLPLTSALSGH